MKLTKTQHYYLDLLDKSGGVCQCEGLAVRIGEQKSSTGAAISFLNLVANGAIEGKAGKLLITDYGRRLLRPF